MSKGAEHVIDQGWDAYTTDEHAVWRRLYERQERLLPGRVVPAFMDGLRRLKVAAGGIPDFRRLNEVLHGATGWQVVAVPGLIPDDAFFDLLANRMFPSGNFIRRPDQMDYLEEPDVFHDVFGHVPLLMNPVFADFMAAYGEAGLKADGDGVLSRLARLYWYTVEFGLFCTPEGLRIYGAGIVSSHSETLFSLASDSPNRIRLDRDRVLRTKYRIDDFQETYFVIDRFEALFDTLGSDLGAALARAVASPDFHPWDVLDTDDVITRGTGAYATARRAGAEGAAA